jgi:phosphatidylinositol 3-kinase
VLQELILYLLQLVQALKFESSASEQKTSRSTHSAISYDDSGLCDFLIDRAVKSPIMGNRFHWYLMVEVASEDRTMAKMYGRVVFKFQQKIQEVDSSRRDIMRRQGVLVETLAKRAKELRQSKDPRPKKIEKLRLWLADPKNGLATMPELAFPLNARISITGMVAEKCSVFKSNLFPMLLYFQCADGTEYPIIFKDGDDLRQDQLVLQLFTLMHRLLRKENLDLRLTCYDVLATGPLQGMMQFVPSKTIAAIVSEHGTLLNYMRAHNPDEGSIGTYGVQPSVIDNFVRSCGMCTCSSTISFRFDMLAYSWLLCRYLPAWCRRSTSGQPVTYSGRPLLPW